MDLDVAALSRWIDDVGVPGEGPIEVDSLSGGASNEVFRITREGATFALRKPPTALSVERSKIMEREVRVLAALAGTDVPHARLIASCTDHFVLGGSFYLMDLVDGWSPMSTGPRGPAPFDTDPEARGGLGRELIRGIAELAKVDWRARGLEGFGKPDGFHERQVDRWMSQLQTYRFRDIPGLDEAGDWLRHHRPRTWTAGIIHGDYSFANVMFGHGTPARLAAIVDWEMATIGDPLLDLGWVLMRWTNPGEVRSGGSFDQDGMFGRDDVIEYYANLTGLPMDDADYYVVLAAFKNAVVLEGGFARYSAGTADNPKMAAFGQMVLDSAAKAAAWAGGSSLAAR